MIEVCRVDGMIVKGKPKYLPKCHCVQHIFHVDWPGIEARFQRFKENTVYFHSGT
jgi:hypothetical protein